jgi:hypothetical protein
MKQLDPSSSVRTKNFVLHLSAKAAAIRCLAVPNPMTRRLPLDHADYRLDSFASLSSEDLLIQLTRPRV